MSDPVEAPEVRSGLARRPWVLVLGVVLLVVLPLLWAASAPRSAGEPPPVLGRLPDFGLVAEDGSAIEREDLKGRPWVAGVIFTRCPTVCPQLIERLRVVERDTRVTAEPLRFVFFTADPEHDSPEVLAAWARERGVDGPRFRFVTGPNEELRSIVLEGLKLGLGEDGEAPYGIFHATHVVLVDRDSNLRGFYRSDDPEAMDQLVRDAVVLAQTRGRSS